MQQKHLLLATILFFGCAAGKRGGTIPVFPDAYVLSTEERYFKLVEELRGTIIQHQPAYPCSIDSIIYNSTSIVRTTEGDTITIYSPCEEVKFKKDEAVVVSPIEYNEKSHWTKEEIFVQFPRRSPNYPYHECISCKYPNTIGKITSAIRLEDK